MYKINEILDLIYNETQTSSNREDWFILISRIYNLININNDIIISRSEVDSVLLYREYNKDFYNIEIDSDFDIFFSIIPNNRKLMDRYTTKFIEYKDINDNLLYYLSVLFNENI